jgi:hypothetical protein
MFGVQPVTHQSFVLMATIRGGYRWSDRRLPGPDSWTRFSSRAHRANGQHPITSPHWLASRASSLAPRSSYIALV